MKIRGANARLPYGFAGHRPHLAMPLVLAKKVQSQENVRGIGTWFSIRVAYISIVPYPLHRLFPNPPSRLAVFREWQALHSA